MSHIAIAERSREIRPSPAQGRPLRVVPIIGPSHDDPSYRLLDESTLPHVRVTEVSETGSVPELLVQNGLKERVFLMDGQELIGAKQNRILNTDVLVAAGSKLKIPVSCVEQGRWHQNSASFVPGKAASHRTRSGKSRRVHASLRREMKHDADQSAVWAEVQFSLGAAAAESPTSALSDAYASQKSDLDAFRTSITMPADAVGVAVFQGRRLRGIDVFDRHTTLAYFWASLVDSYAIDLLHAGGAAPDKEDKSDKEDGEQVSEMLARAAAANWEGFQAPGEGRDWRLSDPALSGSALVWEEREVIHLQLFPQYEEEQHEASARRRRPRIHRPWTL